MNAKLPLLSAMTLVTASLLTACGGGSDSNNSEPIIKPDPKPPVEEEATVQNTATLISEKANIAVFGNVDKKYFSETQLANGNGVLLLDDGDINSVGFALNLKEKQTDLNKFVSNILAQFNKALADNNAKSNVLVNKVSTNAQGEVVNVTLELDFPNDVAIADIRQLLLQSLNEGQLVNVPAIVVDKDKKLRLDLAFWIANETGFIWANSYAQKQDAKVDARYGDLNLASNLSSNAKVKLTKVTNTFTQNNQGSNAVDILWSIDSSGSMDEEQKNLANGANQFFSSLNKAGIDYRLAVNTQDAYDCKNLRVLTDGKTQFIDKTTPNAQTEWEKLSQPGTWDSATETGFYCVREADLSQFDRPTAKNLVVFVSDEPENETYKQSIYVRGGGYIARDFTDYKNYFLKSGAVYFAITGTGTTIRPNFSDSPSSYNDPSWDCRGEGGSATGGGHFKEIARLTGGSSASICANAASWSVVFDEIIKAASGLASNFTLTQNPIASTVKVTVGGVVVARDTTHQNGYDLVYSTQGTSLVFYGTAIPKAQQKVSVEYSYFAK
ncbi:vWA domain-containing protein [Acinetobacter sp. YH16050]|uniref:vWA domain-containing protein n=1 Tax=Acinetobacter sp. YH16050 TaxID=2601189 RepID=UPI00211DBA4C|nr:vWA domain-containing protein [Acinetobacter sp. YH16050]